MSAIERLLGLLSRILIWVSGAFLAAMAIHVCADVVLKYFFNTPIPGTAEIVARYYMLAAVFLPLAFVELRNSSIAVDLFYNTFPRPVRRLTAVLAYLGQMTFFALLAYQSGLDAMDSFHKQEFLDGQILVYIWPATFFLPIGLWLVCAMNVLRLAQVLLRPDWEDIVTHTLPLDQALAKKEVI